MCHLVFDLFQINVFCGIDYDIKIEYEVTLFVIDINQKTDFVENIVQILLIKLILDI